MNTKLFQVEMSLGQIVESLSYYDCMEMCELMAILYKNSGFAAEASRFLATFQESDDV